MIARESDGWPMQFAEKPAAPGPGPEALPVLGATPASKLPSAVPAPAPVTEAAVPVPAPGVPGNHS